ncbi:hypothetical protein Syun_006853 [Stephania yunnanensis]|uniref:Uncharacterized protein n=1 Tax=Stephania yunnanensis TaxID=152371 RepID=A0AAP0KXA7_9MAGN
MPKHPSNQAFQTKLDLKSPDTTKREKGFVGTRTRLRQFGRKRSSLIIWPREKA